MYWLLVHVSGIPPLEEHMLEPRGDAFRAYQARTNAFFPAPPRTVPEECIMSLVADAIHAGERVALPDPVPRSGDRAGWSGARSGSCAGRRIDAERRFASEMADLSDCRHTRPTPTRSTTRCRRSSSRSCWGRSANIPAASIRRQRDAGQAEENARCE